MSIAITEEHRELEKVARSFLATHKCRLLARELLDSPTEELPVFWPDLAELGWLGLHLAEEYGGSGYGLAELVVVVEQLGRAVAPGPFVPTVIASAVIAAHGTDDQKTRFLPGLADGSTVAGVGFGADVAVADGTASGSAGVVFGGGLAALLVLFSGDDVLVLEASRPGVTVDVPANLDPARRSGSVTLESVSVAPADIIVGARRGALSLARTIIGAEAVGGAQDCLDAAVGYAKVREQFGRTIGTFQAVKHHLANMLVGAEAALATVWDAARAAGGDNEEFQLIAASAATLAVPTYVRNAEMNIQVHGGVGFTWEHDAHLHLRRATTMRAIFGGAAASEDVYALSAAGTTRANFIDLPPEADALREAVRSDAAEIAALDDRGQRKQLIETGYVMPHWPKPWGRAADAVEQLVIDDEFATAGISGPISALPAGSSSH